MQIKSYVTLAAASVFALALSGCGDKQQNNAPAKTVGIVQLTEHPALDAANRGIVDALKARGMQYELDQQNAQADSPMRQHCPTIRDAKVSFDFCYCNACSPNCSQCDEDDSHRCHSCNRL